MCYFQKERRLRIRSWILRQWHLKSHWWLLYCLWCGQFRRRYSDVVIILRIIVLEKIFIGIESNQVDGFMYVLFFQILIRKNNRCCHRRIVLQIRLHPERWLRFVFWCHRRPLPFGPRRPNISPCFTSNERLYMTFNVLYSLVRCSTSMIFFYKNSYLSFG